MTLIAVSGVDGSGKSTQIDLLARALAESGMPTSIRWFRPGYGPVAERVKRVLRLPSGGSNRVAGQAGVTQVETRNAMMSRRSIRLAWLIFAALDSIVETAFVARVKARSGNVVIYDRWIFDALLDLRINFPDWPLVVRTIGVVIRSASRVPDASVLIMVSQEIASSRLAAKEEPFPDSETVATQRRLAYEEYARQNPDLALCGLGSPSSVHNRLWERAEAACL